MRIQKRFLVILGCSLINIAGARAQTVTTEILAQGDAKNPETEETKIPPSPQKANEAAPASGEEGPAPSEQDAQTTVTLEQAQKMAIRLNPYLKNIDERIYQADVFIFSAWSMLLPNLSGNASLTRNQREISIPFPDPVDPTKTQKIVVQDYWNKSFGFSANMALFNPRSIPAIKMAYDDTDKTRLEAQVQKNELLFAVTSTYYQINSLKELIGVNEENLTVAREFQKRSEALKKAGQSTNIDVLRAQIEVMDAERRLEDAKDSYRMAKTALAYLVGIEGDFEITGPEKVALASGDAEDLKEQALAKRAEIQSAEIAKRIASRAETEVWMRWLPSFDVTYNWSWNSAGGFSGEKANWMLIFGAKWNLLEGGSRISELKQRKSMSRMAENVIQNQKLKIRQEIDERILEVNRRKRNMEYIEKEVALAGENHHLVNRQYKVGLVSSLDVVAASSKLAATRINQVVERLQFDLAVLTLKKSAGDYHSLAIVERRSGGLFAPNE